MILLTHNEEVDWKQIIYVLQFIIKWFNVFVHSAKYEFESLSTAISVKSNQYHLIGSIMKTVICETQLVKLS